MSAKISSFLRDPGVVALIMRATARSTGVGVSQLCSSYQGCSRLGECKKQDPGFMNSYTGGQFSFHACAAISQLLDKEGGIPTNLYISSSAWPDYSSRAVLTVNYTDGEVVMIDPTWREYMMMAYLYDRPLSQANANLLIDAIFYGSTNNDIVDPVLVGSTAEVYSRLEDIDLLAKWTGDPMGSIPECSGFGPPKHYMMNAVQDAERPGPHIQGIFAGLKLKQAACLSL